MYFLHQRHVRYFLALLLLLGGCAPSSPERRPLEELMSEAQAAAAEDADSHDHGDHDHGGEADHSEQATADGGTSGGNDDGTSDGTSTDAVATTDERPPDSQPSAPESSPPAASADQDGPTMEQHSDFPLRVALSATCVPRGREVTITVDSGREHTGVVYLAYYAGGESGAAEPYGDGHGGNNGDMADDDGHYEDTWVVSPDAPVGPARVEVMAGRPGGQKSTAVVRFEVVEAGIAACQA